MSSISMYLACKRGREADVSHRLEVGMAIQCCGAWCSCVAARGQGLTIWAVGLPASPMDCGAVSYKFLEVQHGLQRANGHLSTEWSNRPTVTVVQTCRAQARRCSRGRAPFPHVTLRPVACVAYVCVVRATRECVFLEPTRVHEGHVESRGPGHRPRTPK